MVFRCGWKALLAEVRYITPIVCINLTWNRLRLWTRIRFPPCSTSDPLSAVLYSPITRKRRQEQNHSHNMKTWTANHQLCSDSQDRKRKTRLGHGIVLCTITTALGMYCHITQLQWPRKVWLNITWYLYLQPSLTMLCFNFLSNSANLECSCPEPKSSPIHDYLDAPFCGHTSIPCI